MINLKKLLVENVEAPKAKIDETMDNVRSGLQKVFTGGGSEISYQRLENIGLCYIKGSVSEAFQTAIKESRKIAKSFGYKDDETKGKFIKEENDFGKMSAENPEHRLAHVTPDEKAAEHDMSNPEEKREVQIGKEIISIISSINDFGGEPEENMQKCMKIKALAEELVKMHGSK